MDTLLMEATPSFNFAYLITWSQLFMERKSCLAFKGTCFGWAISAREAKRES